MTEYINRAMELADELVGAAALESIASCKGGYAVAKEALRQHLTSLPASGGEPVAWQWRRKADPWTMELTFVRQVFATTDDSEVRPLYAAPPAPSAALIAAVQALELAQQHLLPWFTLDEMPPKITAALSLCRAELDPTIAGEK